MIAKRIDCVHPVIQELVKARRTVRVSQKDLAEKLGYSEDALGNAERGISSPRISMASDWAEYLGYRIVLEKIV
jgi:DNA-binding XRE family transcriptional regulator